MTRVAIYVLLFTVQNHCFVPLLEFVKMTKG